jgi:hypothetical protein
MKKIKFRICKIVFLILCQNFLNFEIKNFSVSIILYTKFAHNLNFSIWKFFTIAGSADNPNLIADLKSAQIFDYGFNIIT